MNRLRHLMDRSLENFFYVLLIAMVLFAMWQVLSRYLFNDPSVVSEEFLRFSLIWLSIVAAAYVAGKSKHVSFELFYEALTPPGQRRLNMLIQTIFIIFALVIMIYGGLKAVAVSLTQLSPVLKIPMGYIYSVLPVSGVLITIYCLLNIYDLYLNSPRAPDLAESGSQPPHAEANVHQTEQGVSK